MCPLPGPVSIQVGSSAEAVATPAGVEGLAEDGHRVPVQRLPLLHRIVSHLPDELPVIAGAFQQLESLFIFIQLRFVTINVGIVFVRLPFQNNCKEKQTNRCCRPQLFLEFAQSGIWYLKRTPKILTS